MFETSSKIIDFRVVESESEPDCLILLSEEEIVLVDLVTDSWPEFSPPYLVSLHSSAVTCLSLHSSVCPSLLASLSTPLTREKFSRRAWPIRGGECHQGSPESPTIIITGHEDGKVKLWLSHRNSLSLLTCLDTARYFITEDSSVSSSGEDEVNYNSQGWPPFRKVGNFDPFTDDPR